jgi:hypothetical protein
MAAKSWNDQPDICEQAEIMWSVLLEKHARRIEIRALPAPDDPSLFLRTYLVTTGNLWGSQTVRVHGEDKLFEVLRLTNKKNATPPTGVEVLDNVARAS